MNPESLKVFIADRDVGPAPTMTTLLFLSTFSSPSSFLEGRFPHSVFGTVTIILSPETYTGKVLSPEKTGPCYGSPVLMLNPALWRGHNNLSPTSNPLERGKPKWEHLDCVE